MKTAFDARKLSLRGNRRHPQNGCLRQPADLEFAVVHAFNIIPIMPIKLARGVATIFPNQKRLPLADVAGYAEPS